MRSHTLTPGNKPNHYHLNYLQVAMKALKSQPRLFNERNQFERQPNF